MDNILDGVNGAIDGVASSLGTVANFAAGLPSYITNKALPPVDKPFFDAGTAAPTQAQLDAYNKPIDRSTAESSTEFVDRLRQTGRPVISVPPGKVILSGKTLDVNSAIVEDSGTIRFFKTNETGGIVKQYTIGVTGVGPYQVPSIKDGKQIPGDARAAKSANVTYNVLAAAIATPGTLELTESGVSVGSGAQKFLINTVSPDRKTQRNLNSPIVAGDTSKKENNGAGKTIIPQTTANHPSDGDLKKLAAAAVKERTGSSKAKDPDTTQANKFKDNSHRQPEDKIKPGFGFNKLAGQQPPKDLTNVIKIGDLYLKVPPTHLTISQMRTSYTVPMLGGEAKPISSYINRLVIKINLVFTGKQIDTDLRRLIEQFKYCPINILKSNDIFDRVIGDNSWLAVTEYRSDVNLLRAIPVTMDEYSLYTIEGHPLSVGCSIQMSIFNYMPYFEGDTTLARMCYTLIDFTKSGMSDWLPMVADDNWGLKKNRNPSTTDLENAVHPYNMDIDAILDDEKNKFYNADLVSKWTADSTLPSRVQIQKILTMSEVITDAGSSQGKSVDSDTQVIPLIEVLCNSMSIHHENIFAWQPIIGFSQPTAQYIGPGPTTVALNFKSDQPSDISKILKTFNESVEMDIFSIYDDRYWINAPLLRFAHTEVCSLREVISTSVPNHPGWTDVNVILSRSPYIKMASDYNPVAQFDDYWGLQRILKTLNDPDIRAAVEDEIAKAGNKDALLGSLIEEFNNNNLAQGMPIVDTSHANPDSIKIFDKMLKNIPHLRSTPIYVEKLITLDSASGQDLKGIEVPVGKIRDSFIAMSKDILGGDLSLFGKTGIPDLQWMVEISFGDYSQTGYNMGTAAWMEQANKGLTIPSSDLYKGGSTSLLSWTSNPAEDLARYRLNGIAKTAVKDLLQQAQTQLTGTNGMACSDLIISLNNKTAGISLFDKLTTFDLVRGKTFWSNTLDTFRAAKITDYWTAAAESISAGQSICLKVSGNNAKKISNQDAFDFAQNIANVIIGYGDTTVDGKAIVEPNQYSSTCSAYSVTAIIKTRKGYVDTSGDKHSKAELAAAQDKLAKEMAKYKIDTKAQDIRTKPWAAHRYFPFVENFIKFNSMESGSVGDWFQHNYKKDLEAKFMSIGKTVEEASSPIFDKQAMMNFLPPDSTAMAAYKLDPYNALSFLAAFKTPSGKREIQPGTDTAYKTTAMNVLLKDLMKDTDPKRYNNDAYYSGSTQLMFGKGLLGDDTSGLGGVLSQYQKQTTIGTTYDYGVPAGSKGTNTNPVPITKVFDDGKRGQGIITPKNALAKASNITIQSTSNGLMPSEKTIDKPLEKDVKYGGLFQEQSLIMTAMHNSLLFSDYIGGTKDLNWEQNTNPSADKIQTVKDIITALPIPIKVKDCLFIKYALADFINKEKERTKNLVKDSELSTKIMSAYRWSLRQSAIITFGGTIFGHLDETQKVAFFKGTEGDCPYKWYDMAPQSTRKQYGDDNLSEGDLFRYFLDIMNVYMILQASGNRYKNQNLLQATFADEKEIALTFSESWTYPNPPPTKWGHKNDGTMNDIKSILLKLQKDNIETITAGAALQAPSSEVASDEAKQFYVSQLMNSMSPSVGMNLAFPTYKLYVIQSNTSDYKYYTLDNFWDFRAVQDIMVVRSKESPMHILKCRVIIDPRYLTVTDLVQQRDLDKTIPTEGKDPMASIKDANTAGEAYFNMGRAPIREGLRISLRLGYHTDPRMMDQVFIGTIVSLNGNMDGGIYDLEAHGDGRELAAPACTEDQSISGHNYRDIISTILRSNQNITHFGRIYGTYLERFSKEHFLLYALSKAVFNKVGGDGFSSVLTGAGVIAIKAVGAGVVAGAVVYTLGLSIATFGAAFLAPLIAIAVMGATATALLFPYSAVSSLDSLAQDQFKWRVEGYTGSVWGAFTETNVNSVTRWMHGNVFDLAKQSAQIGRVYEEVFRWDNDPIDDNIWAVDMFQSFFTSGDKGFMRINNKISTWEVLRDIKRLYPNYCLDVRPYGSRSTIYLGPAEFVYWRTDDPLHAMASQLVECSNPNFSASEAVKSKFQNIAGRNRVSQVMDKNSPAVPPLIPFMKHHTATSNDNIIMNGIRCTPERGWNAVVVSYGENAQKAEDSTPIQKTANADIFPGAIKAEHRTIEWTSEKEVATHYALGLLKEGVEKLYGGTLVLRGNTKIEPYDRIYVADKVNKMYGWIEVECVIHKFDQQMGFTTHVVPNMVCAINSDAYQTYMTMLRKQLWGNSSLVDVGKNALMSAAGLGLGLAVAPMLASVSWIIQLLSIGYLGYNIGSQVKGVVDSLEKSLAETVEPDSEEMMAILYKSMLMSTGLELSYAGYVIGRVLAVGFTGRAIEDIEISKGVWQKGTHSTFKIFKDNIISQSQESFFKLWDGGNKMVTGYNKTPAQNIVNKFNPTIKKLFEKNNKDLNKQTEVNGKPKYAVEPNDIRTQIDEMLKTESKAQPEIKRLLQIEKDKFVENLMAEQKARASMDATIEGRPNSGPMAKTSTKLMGNIFKGVSMALFFKSLEYLPMMLETFIINSCTGNSCISISPVWSRYSMMMAGLDGYQKNNGFMYMKNMLMNVQRTLSETDALAAYSTPTLGATNFNSTSPAKEKVAVQAKAADIKDQEIDRKIVKANAKSKAAYGKVKDALRNAYDNVLINVKVDKRTGFKVQDPKKRALNGLNNLGISYEDWLKIIWYESGFSNTVHNKKGTDCVGLFQFSPDTYSDFTNNTDRTNIIESANAGAAFTRDNIVQLQKWGIPNAGSLDNIYLMQLGQGNALAFIHGEAKNPNGKVSDTLKKKVVVQNDGLFIGRNDVFTYAQARVNIKALLNKYDTSTLE